MDSKKTDHLPKGGAFIFVAATAYACMGMLVKRGKALPDEQLVFARNFICLLILLPWLFIPRPKSLKTKKPYTHLARALFGLLNMYLFFYSLRYILLVDAMLLNNTMPLFVPLVLWVWKKEKIPLTLVPGLVIGFVGVILILRPGLEIFNPAALLALASGLSMSISMANVRELGKFDPIYRILFYYFAISSFISVVPLVWAWENPSLSLWLILIGVGVFAAIYQFFLTAGYYYAPASKISPIIYFAVILSGFFDWYFWGQIPSTLSYIGVVLVIIGAIWCVKTQRKA